MEHTFSVKTAFGTGWQLFKTNWKFIISLGVVTLLAQLFVKGLVQMTVERSPILSFALFAVSALCTIVIALGWNKVLLGFVRKQHPTWETFKTQPSLWLHLVKALIWAALYTLYYALLVVIPFVILWIIGFATDTSDLIKFGVIGMSLSVMITSFIMAIRYQFIPYVLLDNSELRSKAIFKKTTQLTKGSVGKLIWFSFVSLLIMLLGAICLVVGLAISVPVVRLARTKVYEDLKSHM